MAQYFVLRDCFVGDRYYHQGSIVDLPPDLEKSPKNFRAVDEPPAPITPAEPVMAIQQAPEPQNDEPVGVSEPELDYDNAPVYISDKVKKEKSPKQKKK